jgi:hypothetical protein
MGEAKLKSSFRRRDVRIEDRFKLIQGLWRRSDSTELQPIRIVDLSTDGFGMLVDGALNDGEVIQAIFSQPSVLTVDATVVWSQRDQETGHCRVGLVCDQPGKRKLDAIYRQIISSSIGKLSLILPD